MFIRDLADYLEGQGIEDIKIGELPFDEDNIVSLVTSPSPDPDKSIPYYTQTVDVRARFKDWESGYAKLQEIFDLLHQEENYQMGDYHVYLSYAMGMIQDNGRDTERRHLFQLTLGFVFRNSNVGS